MMDKVLKGQVFTPEELALRMVKISKKFLEKEVSILDPCCGHGIFAKAIQKELIDFNINCIDIDSQFCNETEKFLIQKNINYTISNSDYLTKTELKNSFDLIISNPPYVRQENILNSLKSSYQTFFRDELDVLLPKKSNLFIYFLAKNIIDLKPDGIGCTIVFDTINKSKYSKEFWKLLQRNCEIVYEEQVNQPFESVLIDAKIIIFRKKRNVELNLPYEPIKNSSKGYNELGNQFNVCRGLGLLSKKTFVIEKNSKHIRFAKSIVLNAKHINSISEIKFISKALIFREEEEVPDEIKKYLKEKYFYFHKKPLLKFVHNFKTSSLIMNYFFRDYPKFILNPKRYIASDNFYLINHEKIDAEVCKIILSAPPFVEKIISNSRNMGNGLKKIQIYELKETIIPDLSVIPDFELNKFSSKIIKYKKNTKSLIKVLEEYLNC